MDTTTAPPPPRRFARARRVVATIALVVGVTALAGPAAAFADQAAPVVVDGASSLVITPPQWTIITGLVMPFLIAALMKISASSTYKAVIGIVAAAAAATIERATLVDGSALISTGLLLDVLAVYGPQLLSYLGLWSHIGDGGLNGKVLPGKGLG